MYITFWNVECRLLTTARTTTFCIQTLNVKNVFIARNTQLWSVFVQAQKPEVQVQKPEVQAQKPEVQAQKPEVQAQKPEVQAEKPEVLA